MTIVFILPCIYKFGVEKSRFLFMATYLLVFAGFALLFSIDNMKTWLSGLSDRGFLSIGAVFGALAIVGLIVSYHISIRIVENKEW